MKENKVKYRFTEDMRKGFFCNLIMQFAKASLGVQGKAGLAASYLYLGVGIRLFVLVLWNI